MYFTFAIVQAFQRFMPVEGARVASECLVGFAATYRATQQRVSPPPGKAYDLRTVRRTHLY